MAKSVNNQCTVCFELAEESSQSQNAEHKANSASRAVVVFRPWCCSTEVYDWLLSCCLSESQICSKRCKRAFFRRFRFRLNNSPAPPSRPRLDLTFDCKNLQVL
ncbi:hypothetical protein CAOG_009286 [Capsaspora owczarzaki ATCC 30864]|uniref:Uncharacterized protein n=1 Tax=Capsaspora owczarzaki (strain ATCC 30864) TaxID=595528 RepID=A0A0D2WI27_CAPO3|nr:hypothetical protein CAOG_009286 [Capsaspora owczarzaki ATCC 30864]